MISFSNVSGFVLTDMWHKNPDDGRWGNVCHIILNDGRERALVMHGDILIRAILSELGKQKTAPHIEILNPLFNRAGNCATLEKEFLKNEFAKNPTIYRKIEFTFFEKFLHIICLISVIGAIVANALFVKSLEKGNILTAKKIYRLAGPLPCTLYPNQIQKLDDAGQEESLNFYLSQLEFNLEDPTGGSWRTNQVIAARDDKKAQKYLANKDSNLLPFDQFPETMVEKGMRKFKGDALPFLATSLGEDGHSEEE